MTPHRLLAQVLLLTVGLLGARCAQPLPPAQCLTYLADPAHGLTQTRQVGEVMLTASYRPTDLLVSQELTAENTTPQPAFIDSLRRVYAGKLYCTLSLARAGAELEAAVSHDETTLTQTLSYLSTGIAQDVYLRGLGQPDSVAALAAIYTRQYGNTGHSAVLLVFTVPQLDINKGFTLTYRDTQFGLGPVHFVFPAQALRALPALQL